MKCIVCDRCKKIIEDKRKCRVVTCAKPMRPDVMDKPTYRGNDPKVNDIFWMKEICSDCIDELESFFEPSTSGGSTGNTEPPSGTGNEGGGTEPPSGTGDGDGNTEPPSGTEGGSSGTDTPSDGGSENK